MDEDVTLRFPVGEDFIEIPATVVDVIKSRSTGAALRRLSSAVTVSAADARTLTEMLSSSELVDDRGDIWNGRIVTETYRDAAGFHALSIQWEEIEHLHAETVEFEGLSLRPTTSYEERDDDGSLGIVFRARLTAEETERLRAIQRRPGKEMYFSVVRRGVSDEPRRMRFGRVLWQPVGRGDVEFEITLVDETIDARPNPSIWALGGEPQIGHLMSFVERLVAERDALFELLKDANVANDAAIERVRKAGGEIDHRDRYRFFEVDDISRWEG